MKTLLDHIEKQYKEEADLPFRQWESHWGNWPSNAKIAWVEAHLAAMTRTERETICTRLQQDLEEESRRMDAAKKKT